jgi:hypothetical protein
MYLDLDAIDWDVGMDDLYGAYLIPSNGMLFTEIIVKALKFAKERGKFVFMFLGF